MAITSLKSHKVWRSSSTKPYFTPGDNDSEMIAEISVTTHTDPNHIGDVETNYFYQVIATNGGCPIAVSQQMGEFDFGIFPGTTLLKVPSVATEIAFPEIVDAVQMSLNMTTIAEFVYDADGNRVKGTVNGVTTIYIASIFEYQNGAITKYYPSAGGSSAIRRENYAADNGIFYVLGDHLGSTSTIIQQNTTVMKQEYYYPFGGNRGSTFSEITTKRFTGQYHEAGLPGSEGLSYYNARWYDAQLGRFLSGDTLVSDPTAPQLLNRLAYVGNNPLRFTDPTGHYLFEDDPGTPYHPPRPRPGNVRFGGQNGTTWSQGERDAVRRGARDLSRAMARILNRMRLWWSRIEETTFQSISADNAFLQSFGGPVTFFKVNQRCASGCYGEYDWIQDIQGVGIRVYNNANIVSAGVKWAIHEMGHFFEARVNTAIGQNSHIRNTLGNDSNIIRRNIHVPDSPNSGFVGAVFGWQQSREATTGEEFADMMIGWTYNRWEVNDIGSLTSQGYARSQFMNENMFSWLNLVIN